LRIIVLGAFAFGSSYSRRNRKVWERSFFSELTAATLQTRAEPMTPHWRSASVMRSASAARGRESVVTPALSQFRLEVISEFRRHVALRSIAWV
jgi:hypothetical protein